MRGNRFVHAFGALLLLLEVYAIYAGASQAAAKLDTKVIDRVLGKGTVQDGAYVVDMPRTDLKVTVQGGRGASRMASWRSARGAPAPGCEE